ncbi:hypothetical protein CKQ90_36435, partial [Klebsiella pneumoniae]
PYRNGKQQEKAILLQQLFHTNDVQISFVEEIQPCPPYRNGKQQEKAILLQQLFHTNDVQISFVEEIQP